MIKLRSRDESGKTTEWEVTYEQLERRIVSGLIDPAFQVWSDTFTLGQWIPVHELALYRKLTAKRGWGEAQPVSTALHTLPPGRADAAPGAAQDTSAADDVPTRYKALRTITDILTVLAWVTVIVCALGAILSIVAAGESVDQAVLAGLLFIVGGAVGFVIFKAAAESILVLIDIEENTRASRSITQRSLEVLIQLVTRQSSGKQ